MVLLFISFVAGVLTILAPCVLPLLPIIVGRSVTDDTPSSRRLITVVSSLGLSIILFTLLLKASSLLVDIPQDFWKWISGGIILFFGLTMVFPKIWERFSFVNKLSINSNKVLGKGYQKNSIWGDVIIGASLGPIFSACSPTYFVILATVLPVSFSLGIVYLFVYVFGLALALVVISLLGKRIMKKVGHISDPKGKFKKAFGILFIIVAIGIISGYDKKLQIDLLDAGFLDVTKIEQKLLDKNEKQGVDIKDDKDKEEMENKKENNDTYLNKIEKQKKFIFAPEITTPDGFINTGGLPISINEFKGKKVVLLDIWTYSCINCQRTLPYLNEWHKKYEDEGLVIIGLHTPEFAFEKVYKNVEKAVKDFGIKYPVVLDNDFSTWRAYKNQYWPRKYLIDIDGFIVYDHTGEGGYKETEVAIQKALEEKNFRLGMEDSVSSDIANPENVLKVESRKLGSPEIYFGAWRNLLFANGDKQKIGIQDLSLPNQINLNSLYLGGKWNITKEYAENIGVADIVFKYNSKNVYFVAGSTSGVDVEIYQDDKFVKKINIKEEGLYNLIQGASYGEHELRIKIKQSGLQAFTFTFG